jgi:hypothetical protein
VQLIYILQVISKNNPAKYEEIYIMIESDKKTVPKVDKLTIKEKLIQALRNTQHRLFKHSI